MNDSTYAVADSLLPAIAPVEAGADFLWSLLPLAASLAIFIAILFFAWQIRRDVPTMVMEPNTRKVSSKRVAALGFTGWAFYGWANGYEIPMEMWVFLVALWGLKAWQRKGENGHNGKEPDVVT